MMGKSRALLFSNQRCCVTSILSLVLSVCLPGLVLAGLAEAQQPQPTAAAPSNPVETVATPAWEFHPKPGMNQPYITSWRVLGPFNWTEPAIEPSSTDHSEAVARQLDHPFLPKLKVEGGTEENLPSEAIGLQAKAVDTQSNEQER